MAEKKEIDQSRKQHYLDLISTYERTFSRWESRVKKIVQKYRDESDTQQKSPETYANFNILWSNTQTLCAAVYARLPKADVSRRFNDNDPVGRVASLLLERSLDYEIVHYPDYGATMSSSVLDRFLGGRATSWVRYDAKMKKREVQVTEDAENERSEEVEYECAPCDYVHWKDFGHSISRTWEEVTVVWRRVFMTKEALIERFGEEIGKSIPLDAKPDEMKKVDIQNATEMSRGMIYEIWDKTEGRALWLAKSLNGGQIVDDLEDPLRLVNFFPCPRPLYGTLSNESLEPTPDYVQYQSQAQTLDLLAQRIQEYCDAMRVVGTYDASLKEITRIFTDAGNTQMVPVTNWAAYAEKGGLAGAIQFTELKPIYEALQQSYMAVNEVKNQIYEITRISDIMRGSVDPREKLGQSQLKSQYANLGLHAYQWQIAQYATELLQIKAQIICNKFDAKTILAISSAAQLRPSDQQLIPQALALLLGPRVQDPKSEAPNPLRAFRIEVEADSLVQLDEQSEREARLSMLKVSSDFLKEFMVATQSPAAGVLAPLVMEQWKFGLSAFHIGKAIEGEFDEASRKLQEMAAAPKPPPPPDPELVRVQEDAKIQQARLIGEQQTNQQQQAFDVQKFQAESAMSEAEFNAKQQLENQKQQLEAQNEARRIELEHQRQLQQMSDDKALAVWKIEVETRAKVEMEMIKAGMKNGGVKILDELTSGMNDIKQRVFSTPEIAGIDAVRDQQGNMIAARVKNSDGTERTVSMRLH